MSDISDRPAQESYTPSSDGEGSAAARSRSLTLLLLGTVGFHYVSTNFQSWVPAAYGFALAFVALWGLEWRWQQLRGATRRHDDFVAVAMLVFLLTSLVASPTWLTLTGSTSRQFPLVYALPMVLGLAALAWRRRDRSLLTWAAVMVVGLAAGMIFQESTFRLFDGDLRTPLSVLLPQIAFGAAAVAGVLRFVRETVGAGTAP
jgi:hypothetical protein